jgi:hypothetical protein
MIAHIYPSVLQAASGRGYAGCLEGCFQGCRGEAMQDLGYELPRIHIPRTSVNRVYAAVRYPTHLRSAQTSMGGLPLPASWTLTCLGAPENSFSTEVSRSVVVLDP